MVERTALEERHQRLENKIHTFHSKLDTMMEGIENDDLSLRPVEQEDFPTNPHLDDDQDSNGWQTIAPEHMSIFMPSSLQFADIQRLGLVTMASQELELRQGQANDALEGLRLALGHKTLLFRTKVRVLLQGE